MSKHSLPPRKIRLCLEGWYYLLVLSFIASAAILRAANLLLVLATMLILPLILNWRFVVASTRRLALTRRLPRQIVAGEKFHVELTLENNRRTFDVWRILIEETIRWDRTGTSVTAHALFDRVQAGKRHAISYQGKLMDRGVYHLGPSRVSTSFPIGLLKGTAVVPNSESFHVAPQLGTLADDWLRLAKPDEVDEPRSVGKKGIHDGLFYAIREYRVGDSRRSIHWRSTAKLGKPAVKQFERQSDEELNLVLDLSPAENTEGETGSGWLLEVELAVSFFATLLNQICQTGRCELNVLLLGDQQKQASGNANRAFQRLVNESLAIIQPGAEADLQTLTSDLEQYVSTHQFQGPLVIVSTRDLDAERQSGAIPKSIRRPNQSGLPCQWLGIHDPLLKKIFTPPPGRLSSGRKPISESDKSKNRMGENSRMTSSRLGQRNSQREQA